MPEFVMCQYCQAWMMQEDSKSILGMGKRTCMRHPPQLALQQSGDAIAAYPHTQADDGCFDGIPVVIDDSPRNPAPPNQGAMLDDFTIKRMKEAKKPKRKRKKPK